MKNGLLSKDKAKQNSGNSEILTKRLEQTLYISNDK